MGFNATDLETGKLLKTEEELEGFYYTPDGRLVCIVCDREFIIDVSDRYRPNMKVGCG